ncbi:hypothetical protein Tco_0111715 [Tanacetum coccineum]
MVTGVKVMVMFDEEMWWGRDGWRREAAGGRIWWLVVSPEKCGGDGKTGRKMREWMRENMRARRRRSERRWLCRGDGGSAVEMVMALWRWTAGAGVRQRWPERWWLPESERENGG